MIQETHVNLILQILQVLWAGYMFVGKKAQWHILAFALP